MTVGSYNQPNVKMNLSNRELHLQTAKSQPQPVSSFKLQLQKQPHHDARRAKMTHKCLLLYKLLLLENARSEVERKLQDFTNKANADVQTLLNSTLAVPTGQYYDIITTLDVKRQAVEKLLAFLDDFTSDPHFKPSTKNTFINKPLYLMNVKGVLSSNMLQRLQNFSLVSSISKAVQMVGSTTQSIKRLRQFLIPQPKVVKTDVLICSGKSSHSIVDENTTSFSHINASEQEHRVIFDETLKTDKLGSSPSTFASKNNMLERPPSPPPLPHKTVILPEIITPISNNMMVASPVTSWGLEDTKVQHQKQTAFQLLNFLRKDCKHREGMAVTLIKNDHRHTASQIQQIPRAMKMEGQQVRHKITEDHRKSADALPLEKNPLMETKYQASVFKIKRVESSGSIIYTCVIATSTELWDIGDVFTEDREDPSASDALEHEMGKQYQEDIHPAQTSTEILCFETQSLQDTEPQRNPVVATTVPESNHVNFPEFEIRKFEEMEVVVSYIVNPGNFYVQHLDILKQQGLTKDWNGIHSFAEQNCIPDIGAYVMVYFPKHKQWCRAQVIKICGISEDDGDASVRVRDIKVEVKKLDYGDTGIVSLRNTKSLPPDMALLPLQAVRVSLAKVTPVDGRDWSSDSVDWFRAMVDNRTLYARFYPEGPTITVELFLERGKMGCMRRGASLSLRLAQNGHAKHAKLKNVGLIKRGTFQLEKRKQESAWEKYLISCYTQSRKQF